MDATDRIEGFISGGGYRLISLDKEGVVDDLPVLSFMVCSHATVRSTERFLSVYPVTAERVHHYDDSSGFALVRPDGQVDVPATQSFQSIDELTAKIKNDPEWAALIGIV